MFKRKNKKTQNGFPNCVFFYKKEGLRHFAIYRDIQNDDKENLDISTFFA